MQQPIVFDNVLSETEFRKIQNTMMTDAVFPWYYNSFVNKTSDPKNYFQFTHTFYKDFSPVSNFFPMLENLLDKLNPKAIKRIKSNLLTVTPIQVEHGFHYDDDVDRNTGMKIAIFYVNSNNGYTKFENGQKIESVENRFVIFDGDLKHTGSTCTDQNSRVIINFNYF